MNNLPSRRKMYVTSFSTGIFLFLLSHLFDRYFYSELQSELLAVRAVISITLAMGISLLFLVSSKWYDAIASAMAVFSGIAVTAMAVVSGDGFASPVYAGFFLIIMVFSQLFYLDSRYYLLTMTVMLSQHFLVLSFIPADGRYVLLQLLVLVPSAVIGFLTHHLVYFFFGRTRALESILPICSSCKRVRDDQGSWNQIESYIHKNLGTNLTHGICPECLYKLYGLTDEDLRKQNKN